MFYFIHVLAGALIAKYFPSILPVIFLSLLSHFILDLIPHKDNISDAKLTEKNYNKIKITKRAFLFELADIFIGIFLIVYIFLTFRSILMLIGIFFSLLPDIIKIFYFTPFKNTKIFKKYLHFHSIIQIEVGWFLGILTQIIITIILLNFLF